MKALDQLRFLLVHRTDKALKIMSETKLDKREFEQFKTSVSDNSANTLFNDMKLLFDSAIKNINSQMDT